MRRDHRCGGAQRVLARPRGHAQSGQCAGTPPALCVMQYTAATPRAELNKMVTMVTVKHVYDTGTALRI